MALFEEQITDTLETGAPPIKYEGDEGPQDPRQEAMLAQLKEEYMQYVFEMRELEEPILSFEEWYQMTYESSKMGVQAPQEEMMSEQMMMREPAAYGGIMDTESGRRAYGLGSFFKKITKPFKKIAKGAKKLIKSPIGKIGIGALLAGPALGALTGSGAAGLSPGALGGKLPGVKGFLARTMGSGKAGLGSLLKKVAPKTLAKIGIGAASALPLLGIGTQKEEQVVPDMGKLGSFDFDYDQMIRDVKGAKTTEDFAELNTKYGTDLVEDETVYVADGGRIPFALGSKADFAIEDVMTGGVEDEIGGITGIMRQADLQRKGNVGQFYAAEGGSPSEGGIMDLGGMEKDYRETGGFVDLGAEEKADDVPARLSVNEFVMTADAVRGAGDGDIDLGAKRMEDTMKQLEQKGQQYAGGGERGWKAQMMDEEFVGDNELKMEEGVPIQEMAGGGERGWKAQMLAEEIAEEEYGKEFYDLTPSLQNKIYNRALQEIDDMLMGRKGASDMFEVSERLSEVV